MNERGHADLRLCATPTPVGRDHREVTPDRRSETAPSERPEPTPKTARSSGPRLALMNAVRDSSPMQRTLAQARRANDRRGGRTMRIRLSLFTVLAAVLLAAPAVRADDGVRYY